MMFLTMLATIILVVLIYAQRKKMEKEEELTEQLFEECKLNMEELFSSTLRQETLPLGEFIDKMTDNDMVSEEDAKELYREVEKQAKEYAEKDHPST